MQEVDQLFKEKHPGMPFEDVPMHHKLKAQISKNLSGEGLKILEKEYNQ